MKNQIDYTALLQTALDHPGKISGAYTMFHDYSINNMLLIMGQMEKQNIEMGPIATFNKWKKLGAKVRKGAKALEMYVPQTGKRTTEDKDGNETEEMFTYFNLKRGWFAISQTDADTDVAEKIQAKTGAWDLKEALKALEISLIPFDKVDGNVQGFARKRDIAVNPVAQHKHKTTFHELGHVVLGHTSHSDMDDRADLPRDIRELEAESVAYICCQALGLDGGEYSRGYIQSWFKGDEYPQKSAQRVLKAADTILKAGRTAGIK